MTYLKPPAFTRHLANPLAMRMSARGVATLTLVGRRTGEPRKVPVIPVEVGQSRYLVSPYGEYDWVRNLRAAGQAS
jgi:deazaflavin-dependent oxidoreductase (nitroreductase family)